MWGAFFVHVFDRIRQIKVNYFHFFWNILDWPLISYNKSKNKNERGSAGYGGNADTDTRRKRETTQFFN